MMMKLGLHSAILPEKTFEEVIDFAAETGFECAEICCWPVGKAARRYAGITHIDIDTLDDAKIEHYKAYAAKKGVQIATLGYYPNPMDCNKEAAEFAVEHLKKLIVVSAKMGVNLVTTFIGKDKTKTVEENLELFQTVWAPIMRLAEEQGVRVAIENCPMYYTKDEWPGGSNLASTPYVWRKMFELSPNLGLCYDPSHPYLLNMSVTKPVYEFSDRIFHVHFKDIKIYQDKLDEYGYFSYPSLWHSPKLPGLGGVDFPAFVSALNDIHYTGGAVIEVEDKAFERCEADVKDGIRLSYRYLRTMI